ncbi:uncharacterized protein DUF4296 [Winogradskyella eximia]|uniref:Uncharacterized protein DUF4296 n=1 Tax=Winogradskyella eximia TaxID=262006 RepID=A0A3D9HBT9_9FLAO|nr:DUF4296 domain-containing protein [Winogradskyella eximia]RED46671.1 uncharacterized protein DUF4296 [Winogradskyella eximia]|tara:strand:+ start:353 stop:853 length:501 start_codon:yes stop_codon:yes gene_type:complete
MIKRISIILVLSVFVLACNGIEKPKKPDNLISKDQMSDLLYDLYIINSAKGVNRNLLQSNGFNPENYILEKYNIDSTQFADSNTYYTFDTEEYSAIINKVKARLEKEKEIFEELQDKENDSIKKHKDSIRNLDRNRNLKTVKKLDSTVIGKKKIKRPVGIKDSLLQ